MTLADTNCDHLKSGWCCTKGCRCFVISALFFSPMISLRSSPTKFSHSWDDSYKRKKRKHKKIFTVWQLEEPSQMNHVMVSKWRRNVLQGPPCALTDEYYTPAPCKTFVTISWNSSVSSLHWWQILRAAFSCLCLHEKLFFISWPTYSLTTWWCNRLAKSWCQETQRHTTHRESLPAAHPLPSILPLPKTMEMLELPRKSLKEFLSMSSLTTAQQWILYVMSLN